MEKINVHRKDLIEVIFYLEKASNYLGSIGNVSEMVMIDDELNTFEEAEECLGKSIRNLKKIGAISK